MTTTTESPMAESSLPPRPVGPGRRRLAPSMWVVMVAAGLLTTGVVAGLLVAVPFLVTRPGAVWPMADKVQVSGAPTFRPQEPVAFTTIRRPQGSVLSVVGGWFDSGVDVLSEELVLGGQSAEENRQRNRQLMTDSQVIAVAVALRHLGYEVPVHTAGVQVQAVAEGSPADGVLRPGDVIVAVDGQPIEALETFPELVGVGGPGATHVLSVERDGQDAIDIEVTTAPAPDDPDRALVGVLIEPLVVDVDLPVDVSIDVGDVGGPSAGLAFTLAVLDVLTPGELTGGRRVATTGTIDLAGRVGPVGGAAQKVQAAIDEGIEVFLVPPSELAEVQAAAGDRIQVIPVETLDDALDALADLGGNAGEIEGSAAS